VADHGATSHPSGSENVECSPGADAVAGACPSRGADVAGVGPSAPSPGADVGSQRDSSRATLPDLTGSGPDHFVGGRAAGAAQAASATPGCLVGTSASAASDVSHPPALQGGCSLGLGTLHSHTFASGCDTITF